MTNLTSILGNNFSPDNIQPLQRIDSPEIQIANAMRENGIEPPDQFWFDGKIHRFSTNGKKDDKSGWYVLFGDKVPAGRFGDWRMADGGIPWKADIGRQLTTVEIMAQTQRMAEAQSIRQLETKLKNDTAAKTCHEIWSNAGFATDTHAYLVNKGVKAHGTRITGDGRLILPLFTEDGELSSLQYINADGKKQFQDGGSVAGKYWFVGSLDDPGVIYIAEGFATASAIYEVSGRPCVVTYSASNLIPVTETLRTRFGAKQELVIVADNDESGTGKTCADKAALKSSAKVIMPPVLGDANDYRQSGHDLLSLLNMPIEPRFKLLTAQDLENFEPISWLIKGVMPTKGLAQIYGPSKAGKSFLAFDMACAVAEGRQWFGYRVKEAEVVYVALEGEAGYRLRAEAWKKQHGRPLPNKLRLIMQPFKINQKQDLVDLAQVLPQNCLVIIDTQNRAAPDANENDSKDMGLIIEGAKYLQDACQGMIATVAHSGKDASRGPRGHSSQIPAVDCAIEVSRDGDRRNWKADKVKDGADGKDHAFRLEIHHLGDDEDGDALTSCSIAMDNVDAPSNKVKLLNENQRQGITAYWLAAESTPLFDNQFNYIGVHLEDWRNKYYEINTSDNNETKRKAFQRCRKELSNMGILEVSHDVYKINREDSGIREDAIKKDYLIKSEHYHD